MCLLVKLGRLQYLEPFTCTTSKLVETGLYNFHDHNLQRIQSVNNTLYLTCLFIIIINFIKGQTLCSQCGTIMKLVFHNPTTKKSYWILETSCFLSRYSLKLHFILTSFYMYVISVFVFGILILFFLIQTLT